MRDLDETDLDILRALLEDARRPWADIAEQVDLSPPAVADRVDRLRDIGLIRRFTLDIDRSRLRGGVPVLVTVDPTDADAVRAAFRAADAVEHVFVTAEREVIGHARVPEGDVPRWLFGAGSEGVADVDGEGVADVDGQGVADVDGEGVLDETDVADYRVTLLAGGEWTPSVDGTGFALACAQCGNTVTSQGTTARVGGDVRHFCCPSCESAFRERYERLESGIEG